MTTEPTTEALLIEVATLLRYQRALGRVYPLRGMCFPAAGAADFKRDISWHRAYCYCEGRGWVPVALGDSTLDAAAALCGIEIDIETNILRAYGKCVAYYNERLIARQGFDPTSAESRTRAKLMAILEVLK